MKLRSIAWTAACIFFLSNNAFAEDADPFLANGGSDEALPAPSLGAAESSAASGTAAPAPSQPAEQAPIPITSIPGKTENSPSAVAAPPKDIYEEYEDFLEREGQRSTSEDQMKQRNLFAHEGGSWQFGLEYVHRAFGDYNFNHKSGSDSATGTLRSTPIFADTQGGILSLGYFPLHSLTFGRLGAIAQAGIYFSKFTIDTPVVDQGTGNTGATVKDDTKRQQATSVGIRAVYEFDYYLGQMFVPFLTLGVDNVRFQPYKVSVGFQTGSVGVVDIPANNITSQSYGAGMHINLNRIEPVVASRALVNVGVKKFYLSYLALQRSGSLSGLTHSLALRFEF